MWKIFRAEYGKHLWFLNWSGIYTWYPLRGCCLTWISFKKYAMPNSPHPPYPSTSVWIKIKAVLYLCSLVLQGSFVTCYENIESNKSDLWIFSLNVAWCPPKCRQHIFSSCSFFSRFLKTACNCKDKIEDFLACLMAQPCKTMYML